MAARRWRENEAGRLPASLNTKGARVRVRLRNGITPPETWEARGTRWSLANHPFDVVAYLAEIE